MEDMLESSQPKKKKEQDIQHHFKKKSTFNDEDEKQIFLSVIARERFNYTTQLIADYIMKCLCVRNLKKLKERNDIKNHIYYKHASEQLLTELDIVTLIKTVKNLRLMS